MHHLAAIVPVWVYLIHQSYVTDEAKGLRRVEEIVRSYLTRYCQNQE